MSTRALFLVAAFGVACASPKSAQTSATPPPSESPCEAGRRQTGMVVTTPDNASLWYDLKGPPDAPPLLFLHGGPGYNVYSFAKAVGPAIEKNFRVLYLDQRGCGRSFSLDSKSQVGMTPTVDDIAWLQQRLHLGPLNLIGHSFGGAVAMEFARRYPENTAKVILVDTTHDFHAALAHQIETVKSHADEFGENADAVREIASKDASDLERLGALYALVGRLPMQRRIHFATEIGQEKMEADDAASGLLSCTNGRAVQALVEEGWLRGPPDVVLSLSPEKGVLFAGRHSHAIGPANIEAAAAAWNVPVVWFEDSGHFVFVEESPRFVDEVERFLLAL